MQSRFIINLILLLIVVGVSLYLTFTSPDDEGSEPVAISDVPAEQIQTIRIERKERPAIHFSKDGDTWMMRSPFEVKARPQRIEALLGLLATPSVDQLDAGDAALDRMNLQTPEVTLRLDDEVFAFGDVNPLDQTRYVLYRDTIHLINDHLYPQLATGAGFFIDTKVVPDDAAISMVQYPQFRLLKQEGRWQLESALDISDERVQQLGRVWSELRAGNVRAYEPLEPLYEISVTLDNGEIIHYAVVSDLPTLILARPDLKLQYHIPEYLSEQLFPREDIDTAGAE